MLPLRLSLLLFVAFPLVEIALLIKAGETIGFWATVGLLVAAAALGVLVIRREGLAMVGRMLAAASEGRLALASLLDSYAAIAAGFLLIAPGFLSDALGLLLLVPPLRRWMLRRAVSGLLGRRPDKTRPLVIETTYKRLEDDKPDPRREP